MFRKRIFPRSVIDFFFMAFLVVIIPIAFCFEMFIVLPVVHPNISLGCVLHILLATFMLINTTSNYVYLVSTDTSVQATVNPARADPETWMFCPVCDIFIPPRSWHCTICNTCILKRDHHCQFGGCCVGYKNYRYFFFFLACFGFSCVYMFFINAWFIKQHFEVHHLRLLLSFLFPIGAFALAISPFDLSDQFAAEQWYVVFFALNTFGVVISLVLLWKHGYSIGRNLTMCEVIHKVYDFDLGSVKLNLIQVLGRRWYLTWISPLVYSELPSDGVSWATRPCKSVKVL